MTWIERVLDGLPVLISGGALGSVITVYVNSHVDRRKAMAEYRRARLAEWREALNAAVTFQQIVGLAVWSELREYMTEQEVESMFTHWVTTGSIGVPITSDQLKIQRLHDVVNRVERKWRLI